METCLSFILCIFQNNISENGMCYCIWKSRFSLKIYVYMYIGMRVCIYTQLVVWCCNFILELLQTGSSGRKGEAEMCFEIM